MSNSCQATSPQATANCNDVMTTLDRYEPNIGAPFQVVLIDSVQQRISPKGEVIETAIPNLSGLLKEAAFARSLDDRKFSPEDIRFVRKAVGLRAIDLAELLGVSPEHLSRCENGDRALSIAAEKLLRVIILKKRHSHDDLVKCMDCVLASGSVDETKKVAILSLMDRYKAAVQEIETAIFDLRINSVFDPNEGLAFEFELVSVDEKCFEGINGSDESWKKAA